MTRHLFIVSCMFATGIVFGTLYWKVVKRRATTEAVGFGIGCGVIAGLLALIAFARA